MTRLERLAHLRALRVRIDDEIADLTAQLARLDIREPKRATRLETITEEQRVTFLAAVAANERARRTGWLTRRAS